MASAHEERDEVLLRSDSDGIATMVLNRPADMNCLTEDLISALDVELRRVALDTSIACVVIEAAGKVFCAGHNLKDMLEQPTEEHYQRLFSRCSAMMMRIHDCPVPVIAKVQGHAVASGCQLVAACDMAIASDTAKFAVAGINMGTYCATPAVALQRKLQPRRAFEMLFTGQSINAATAVEWGLINYAVPFDQLDTAVQKLTGEIATKSRSALRFGKEQFRMQQRLGLAEGYEAATSGIARLSAQDDAVEGMRAFLERRPPTFKS